ncbi:MAG: nucleoside-diphosphate sugar epimerase/dehydratase [Candidatus Bipolaricaulota bacterium]|nr:nucleoside-diphosphate sugar epimerase/dehydratase [Candidatus Bipolaricaulota bacterium]
MRKLFAVPLSGSRIWRTLAFVGMDAAVLALSLYLAFLVRFDGQIAPRYLSILLSVLPLAVGVKVVVLASLGMYRFSWAYVGMEELVKTVLACAGGSLAFAGMLFALRHWPAAASVPRSIIAVDFAFSLLGIGGIRFFKRALSHMFLHARVGTQGGKRTLIVGAGDAGAQLVRALKEEKQSPFFPVGFVDDDPTKHGLVIHGVRVLGSRSSLPDLIWRRHVASIVIAMPSASARVLRETVKLARESAVKEVKILPSLSELYSGEIMTTDVREVKPEDVLPRNPVEIDTAMIRQSLSGKRVLVTGASGSIGSEICRQVLRFGVEELLALDIDETGLFNLNRELKSRSTSSHMRVIIGDVRDRARMRGVFSTHHPQVVFHAAAYKHVPLMEQFPAEAVNTNVFGTKTVLEEARRNGVEVFVFISTDKAVNPTSVMGATKRVAETIVRSPDNTSSTRCMAVRFGNVLGSRGSVIPTFVEQIKRGGPVTVTHPDMKRYFMITSEAVLLVLQAGAMGRGGEVFVLDMGESVLILDLAKELIRFHGYEPDQDIAIVFTGVRPGEKLCEELLTAEEGTEATKYAQIFVAKMNAGPSSTELSRYLEKLAHLIDQETDRDKLRVVLKEMVFSSTVEY